jgi:hypothetical protein
MSYYTSEDKLELIDVVRSWGLSFTRSCIVYYLVRAGRKDGEAFAEAINKACHYADLEKRPRIDYLTPSEVGEAFKLTDEQTAAVYIAMFGTNEELSAALRKVLPPKPTTQPAVAEAKK